MTTQVFVARNPESIEVVVSVPNDTTKTYIFKDMMKLISKMEECFTLAAECAKDNPKDEDALWYKEQALALVQAFEQLTGSKRS
jgi:hypothetical protein